MKQFACHHISSISPHQGCCSAAETDNKKQRQTNKHNKAVALWLGGAAEGQLSFTPPRKFYSIAKNFL